MHERQFVIVAEPPGLVYNIALLFAVNICMC